MAAPDDIGSGFLATPMVMYLSDLKTLETMQAQFNPAEFTESVKVVWARLSPPGLSHERLHYDHTENYKASFELTYDALVQTGDVDDNLDARKFLMSLCYARRGARTVSDGAPPRVLFVWPEMVSITAVITDLKFKNTRFNRVGSATFFKVDVSLEEIRDERLFSEDVRRNGTQRVPELPEEV